MFDRREWGWERCCFAGGSDALELGAYCVLCRMCEISMMEIPDEFPYAHGVKRPILVNNVESKQEKSLLS